ncbi:BamA/OMP85 family outer membrane protein [Rufibacter latericius]|uniref:Outer membrane protein assembly factor BamA n=1 Tax=Rufibacter latericius TaxID=2487040 RepID=A0A3M9MT03_9BACT|nr:POTRA domain-containing protein [Rufibacter latericius]RNI28609.1 outer membrane protein assembly factor BamA [Rufibacter latericius]
MSKYFWLLCLLVMSGITATAQIRLGVGGSNATTSVDYANPKKYKIGGITVSGAKFLDPTTLISLTGLKIGDEIDVPGDAISRAIQKLWDQGILGGVDVRATKIEGDVIYLDFFLTERPRLSRFDFSGASKAQIEDIQKSIALNKGRVVTDALLNSTRTTVQKFYQDKGYLNAQVVIRQIPDSVIANSVALEIRVDKGEKVRIGQLDIERINAATGEDQKSGVAGFLAGIWSDDDKMVFSESQLKRKLKKTKEKKFYKVFTGAKFNKTEFEADKKLLLDFYNSEGFRDATIVSDSIYKISDDRIGVKLVVDEGRRYYYRNISWSGNYLYDDAMLARVLGLNKGDIYNREELDKRLNYNPSGNDITSLYMDDGYLFFQIEPVEVAVEGDSIDIEMRLSEGSQATINSISVSGNTKTSDHVVLRELRTLPGQNFSRAALIRSQRELSNLGYFDPEKIGMNPIPNPENGTVDIQYTVEERPNDQITLSGGWGGGLGAVGTVGLVLNNFSLRKATDWKQWRPVPSGDGQRLALNIQANGKRYQSYSLSFTEPWLGGRRPNSLTVSLSKSIQRFNQRDEFGQLQDAFIDISGASVNLGRRLRWPDDYFTLSNSISYFRYNMSNGSTIFQNYAEADQIRDANNISFITSFARSSIDNPTYTRSGSSIGLNVTFTPPYSLFKSGVNSFQWIEFHKWMFDASWFHSLSGNGKLVLNTRAHFGFIGTYGSNKTIGPFERFKLGGSGLGGGSFIVATDYVGLRGYEDESISPNGAGGIAFNKYVAELRYPVSLNPAATVFVLGFAEAGNNFGSYREYDPFKLYRSVGVGARVFMAAFGLLGFDYGWGLDTVPGRPGANGGQFHFIIGQQIR